MNVRNHVQLIGRIGQKPEFVTLDSGRSVANVSLATNDSYIGKSGEKVEQTEWHRVVAYGTFAELFRDRTDKGHEVMVHGTLRTRKFTAKDGTDHYVTEIIVQQVFLMNREFKAQG
jgi:single-strand DNA-binding protein